MNSTSNIDTITDLVSGADKIDLGGVTFAAIGTSLDASEFFAGRAAADPNDYVIYQSDTGWLLYDADGKGTTSSAVHFATVTRGLTVVSSDFVIA